MAENIQSFIDAFSKSLAGETFVKMTLGNYKGAAEQLQKLSLRRIDTKKGRRLAFQFRYETREVIKNYEFAEGVDAISKFLAAGFRAGHLFTTENDFQLSVGKKSSRLQIVRPTFSSRLAAVHDREKRRLVDSHRPYLKALGITADSGEVLPRQQNKWRQINKFVEILTGLIDSSMLKGRDSLSIIDMGSGKGYLTFALYDYLSTARGINVTMTGVDAKAEMVDICRDIAVSCEFDRLRFVNGTIQDYDPGRVDILIALHACDTATDDAIFKGISADARIIVAAPCCHKEIRRQLTPPAGMKHFLKHGILLERTAEIVTDGLRSMLLEASGYGTKVFEFIAAEHTPKNTMIVGLRQQAPAPDNRISEEIAKVKAAYGIRELRLERLLT